MSNPEDTTAADFEIISLCVTKRCVEQLRNVSRKTGRQVESLAEAALEDACIQSEREYPPDLITAAVRRGA